MRLIGLGLTLAPPRAAERLPGERACACPTCEPKGQIMNIAVIGAGIAGLASAWLLHAAP